MITVSSDVAAARTFGVGGLQPGERYEIRVTAYNSAGATPALYTVTTAALYSAGSVLGQADEGRRWVGGVDGRRRTWGGLGDHRILVPFVVSTVALCLIAATLVIYFNKRRSVAEAGDATQKSSRRNSTKDVLTTPMAAVKTPRSPFPHNDHEAPGDDIYHYASASYQFGRLSPPPVADDPTAATASHPDRRFLPPRPLQQAEGDPYCKDLQVHAHGEQFFRQHESGEGFAGVVYQPPSLHGVSDASLYRSGSYEELSGNVILTADYGQTADRTTVAYNTI
ncbi:uncharacterized protein LOC108664621 [Hyalella azteca]|uniref:Uncharacterized protein LOC108664621 n=1 Tax=Hyalella azteca TaxID=294128 RepID=A0A8B7MZL0_HYAAZ|nr:uncharacterized protein LOC108664621 [Hyalella azteca]